MNATQDVDSGPINWTAFLRATVVVLVGAAAVDARGQGLAALDLPQEEFSAPFGAGAYAEPREICWEDNSGGPHLEQTMQMSSAGGPVGAYYYLTERGCHSPELWDNCCLGFALRWVTGTGSPGSTETAKCPPGSYLGPLSLFEEPECRRLCTDGFAVPGDGSPEGACQPICGEAGAPPCADLGSCPAGSVSYGGECHNACEPIWQAMSGGDAQRLVELRAENSYWQEIFPGTHGCRCANGVDDLSAAGKCCPVGSSLNANGHCSELAICATNKNGEYSQCEPGPDKECLGEAAGSDPVDPANGEFHFSRCDIVLPGRGIDFRWCRSYSNRFDGGGAPGSSGWGWLGSYDYRLKKTESQAQVLHGDKVIMAFRRYRREGFLDGNGGNEPPENADWFIDRYVALDANVSWDLTPCVGDPAQCAADGFLALNATSDWQLNCGDDDAGCVFETPGGRRWHFTNETTGLLQSIEDRFGNHVLFERNDIATHGNRNISQIQDTLGRIISPTYDARGFLDQIRVAPQQGAQSVIWVDYHIDDDGRLVSAVDGTHRGETYRYTSGLEPDLNNNLVGVSIYQSQEYITNTYGALDGARDRVTRQVFGGSTTSYAFDAMAVDPNIGGTALRICPTDVDNMHYMGGAVVQAGAQEFSLRSTVTDANGVNWTYYSDRAGRVMRMLGPDGKVWNYNYAKSKLTAVQEPDGLRRCYSHDALGRVESETVFPAPGRPAEQTRQVRLYAWLNGGQLAATAIELTTPNDNRIPRAATIEEMQADRAIEF